MPMYRSNKKAEIAKWQITRDKHKQTFLQYQIEVERIQQTFLTDGRKASKNDIFEIYRLKEKITCLYAELCRLNHELFSIAPFGSEFEDREESISLNLKCRFQIIIRDLTNLLSFIETEENMVPPTKIKVESEKELIVENAIKSSFDKEQTSTDRSFPSENEPRHGILEDETNNQRQT